MIGFLPTHLPTGDSLRIRLPLNGETIVKYLGCQISGLPHYHYQATNNMLSSSSAKRMGRLVDRY